MKTVVDLVTSLKTYFTGKDTDAKQAVEAVIASVEADATSASKGYSVGEQLILNDTLYDVTATITAGDALTVGTNISVAVPVTEQIADVSTTAAGKASKDVIDTEYETIGSAALYSHTDGTVFYGANGNLYKATTDIAVGDTLTVGTNCALDNVVGAVNDLEGNVSSLNSAIANKESTPTVLTQTLAASATSLTFTDASIGNNSRIRAYSNPFVLGLITDMTQSGTSVTLTCNAQSSAVSVSLEVRN